MQMKRSVAGGYLAVSTMFRVFGSESVFFFVSPLAARVAVHIDVLAFNLESNYTYSLINMLLYISVIWYIVNLRREKYVCSKMCRVSAHNVSKRAVNVLVILGS